MINGHGDDTFSYPDIRVNFSSNVYTHFDHEPLFQHLAQRLDNVRSYPEPTPTRLEAALARQLGIQPDEICVTNGATEAIYLIAQTFRRCRTAILQPTFAEYADACRLHEHRIANIYSLADVPDDAETVWLCNPNNPTGQVIPRCDIEQTTRQQRLFVIDQSYAPFTTEPLLTPQAAVQQGNILLIHSMTKQFAVPGLRIGYLTGASKLLREVKAGRMPWSVNQVAIDAAFFLLAHANDYRLDLAALSAERRRVAEALRHECGVEVWPSDTHILLCRLRMGRAAALKQYLAEQHGLLVRDASNFHGLTPDFFRIALQSPRENDLLIRAIAAWNMN